MSMASVLSINVIGTVGIQEEVNAISSLENYPNPFSNSTTITYEISQDANVNLSIVDLLGNTIAMLTQESKSKGVHIAEWNAESVSEGMYLMQLKVNNRISTKKLIITR